MLNKGITLTYFEEFKKGNREKLDILISLRDFGTHGICASACADTERFLMKGGWIQKPLKVGHHRPTSKTPLNGVSLAGR